MQATCETRTDSGVDRPVVCGRAAAFIVEGPFTRRHPTCREHAREWMNNVSYPRCELVPLLWPSCAERIENGDCDE